MAKMCDGGSPWGRPDNVIRKQASRSIMEHTGSLHFIL
jgi:hypothetical protein